MSVRAAPTRAPEAPALQARLRTRPRDRSAPLVRLASFAAFALYGVDRWARLIHPAPTLRLLGLVAVAVAIAAAVPGLRRYGGRPGRAVVPLLAAAAFIAAFPVSGVPWSFVVHVRIVVTARMIGHGLGMLGGVLVPYLGRDPAIRAVTLLGAAILLLDAAAVLAFAPREFGDGRRAATALPLIALAVVPSALVHPQMPALQGLLLTVLVALLVWGERLARDGGGVALAFVGVAAVVGAAVAPHVDPGRPWVDFEAWAGGSAAASADRFDWNQTYGALRWPQDGRIVLTVHAEKRADYWKAENLSTFNGTAWVAGPAPTGPALPAPTLAAQARFIQTVRFTVDGLTTPNVIAGSGYTYAVDGIAGVQPGNQPGTWNVAHPLDPGASYTVQTYSPTPTPAQLTAAGPDTRWAPSLASYLTLGLGGSGEGRRSDLTFATFRSPGPAITDAGGLPVSGSAETAAQRTLSASPYARADALAQRLAAGAATPYAFVLAVQHYLDDGAYIYDQDPPQASHPLLSFLFASHQGYCQQFSGAMALLLRMGGVPARVASGFTTGYSERAAHTYAVTDTDAHAWDEVWFPRYGWVKFDPTPTVAPARGGNGVSSSPEALKQAADLAHRVVSTPAKHASVSPTSRARGRGTGSTATRTASGSDPWPVIATILAALAVMALAAARWWRRGHPPGDAIAELERALARTGRPAGGALTLATLEQRLSSTPEAAGYVRELRLARYGAAAPPAAPAAAGRRALRRALGDGLGVVGRLRALWGLPPRVRPARRRQD